MGSLSAASILMMAAVSSVAGEEGPELIVHEWGVLVRQVTFPETVGPPSELVDSLPSFVVSHSGYKPQEMHRIWKKPVLHFYGKEQDITVEVLTPTGRPLVSWPKPFLLEQTFWDMGSGMKDAVGLRWKGRLVRERPDEVGPVRDGHWWKRIRGVKGLWFDTGEGAERFVFYEATGRNEPSVEARIDGERLILTNHDQQPTGMVLVIINNGDARFLTRLESIEGKGTAILEKEAITERVAPAAVVLEAFQDQWRSFGMTESEAKMITSVWEEDLCHSRGFMVISRIPEQVYENFIFPLKIQPEPDELVRAAVILDTLPGIEGRLAWLPGVEEKVTDLLGNLGSADPREREAATSDIAAYGDLARDVLESVRESDDLEVRMRLGSLLAGLDREAIPPPHVVRDRGAFEGFVTPEMRRGPLLELVGSVRVGSDGTAFFLVPDRGEFVLKVGSGRQASAGATLRLSGHLLPNASATRKTHPWMFEVKE